MRRFSLVFISILTFLVISTTYISIALAESKERALSLGIKSRLYFWDSQKMKQFTWVPDVTYDPDTIAEVKSDSGTSVGPEFEYYKEGFFLRGFYLYGKYNFDKGKADRNDMGIDVGYEVLFVGFRQMDVSFKFTDADIIDHSISDLVLGILLRTKPGKSGFIANFETVLGVRGLLDEFSHWGDFTSRSPEEPRIVEFEIDVGYRFKTIPLALNMGYGLWIYEKPIREYEKSGSIPYGGGVYRTITKEYWDDTSHGPSIKIVYGF
ncbi:MAG: hypothetical protein HZA12_06520 [Nitrospirae bacterium]|nr:hypothetical protein [Nitrospirota bacterium]